MTDRDRLAADLRDNALLATVGVTNNDDYWPAMADRLIALGWTRRKNAMIRIRTPDDPGGWTAQGDLVPGVPYSYISGDVAVIVEWDR